MTITLIPCEHTLSPAGVLHIIMPPPVQETLCGMSTTGRGWALSERAKQSVVCLPCRASHVDHEKNVRLGNYAASEGVDECRECGYRNWENDHCLNCGNEWKPDCVEDDDAVY